MDELVLDSKHSLMPYEIVGDLNVFLGVVLELLTEFWTA